MSVRLRRFLGCLAIVAFMAGYIWLATVIAGRLPENRAVQYTFLALAGVLWGVPLLPLISWIQRPR